MSPLTVTKVNRNVTVSGTANSRLTVSGGPSSGNPHGTYTHTQASASTIWTITHNLNCYPAATIVDSAGTVVIGEIEYLTSNVIRVTFTAAFAGKAYLN
ncbi:hypothetical protein UFOVP529_103 [uncultured Caudovirales phage]|uniref:Uncharacterized protein n=1 Tax=uncultured Caudovirales phage TaxID=2100421 RepID=A0A6J5MQC5_9CAUD|nr:hypothetical protein UFOVP529_103 [uncultured Caudovirales phage]CAB4190193.1 hypothetical protein UFOVP1191_41 [uncultured Caudovirales phage]CAB4194351.1 hypothetical protein UFOVP1252_18 [uncultured Caudovirales phage]